MANYIKDITSHINKARLYSKIKIFSREIAM